MAKNQANGITWTLQALDCYKRNCQCEGCIIKEIMTTECHMKESIDKILKEIGPPIKEILIFSRITKKQVEIIKAIKRGYKTVEDLAEYFEVPKNKMQGRLRVLYNLAKENGCSFPNKKTKLPVFIEFIERRSKEVADEYYL